MAISKIQSESMNLADTFAFTGTVTGTGTGLELLATIDATPSASTFEYTMDYDSYNNFLIIVDRISGSSTSTSENLDVKFKMDGTLDDGASTPYFTTNTIEFNTVRNINATDNMEFITTNNPSKMHSGIIHCVNFSNNDRRPQMHFSLGGATGGSDFGHYIGSCGMDVTSKQVTAIRYAFTAGNVTIVKQKIYGITE